ncbi:hypothetical protein OAX78_00495, partial [Planctomycetota bacterium]|nr:hypothetical protein [Planctomycetota bacterium]
SLAVRILEMMAGLNPTTVANLSTMVAGLPGFLQNLVCSGLSNDIQALDALAKSGALDALLPVAKTFEDRDEMPLLVSILVRLNRDYDQTIRPIEPDVAVILESGALEEMVAIVDTSRTVYDPVSGESVADILSEALAELVDDDAVRVDRHGVQVPSKAMLLLNPLIELDRRLIAQGRQQDLADLADDLFQIFFARVTVNGQEVLQNGSMLPLTAISLDTLAGAIPTDPSQRSADVDQAQQELTTFLTSKDSATLLALLQTIHNSPAKAVIHRSLVNLLTPNRNKADDIFGGVVRVAVILMQSPPDLGPIDGLRPFLARVADPTSPLVPDALRAFERLLTADSGRTVLNVLRAAFNPAPGQLEPPVTVILRTVQTVSDAGGPSSALDRAALADALNQAVALIRDDTAGLGYLYQLIRTR